MSFTDYIREAHRCLRLDGELHIWEPASYFDAVDVFRAGLEELGFEVSIRAFKSARLPHPDLTLRFRGHAP